MAERRYKVAGHKWAHLAPLSFKDVMREAGENWRVSEPSQTVAEHRVTDREFATLVRNATCEPPQ